MVYQVYNYFTIFDAPTNSRRSNFAHQHVVPVRRERYFSKLTSLSYVVVNKLVLSAAANMKTELTMVRP